MNYRLMMGVAIAALLLFAGCPSNKTDTTSASSTGGSTNTVSPDASTASGGTTPVVEDTAEDSKRVGEPIEAAIPIAELQLTTYGGTPVTLGNYFGKPLVINYFAMY